MAETVGTITKGTGAKYTLHIDPITSPRNMNNDFEASTGIELSEDGTKIITHLSGMTIKTVIWSCGGTSYNVNLEDIIPVQVAKGSEYVDSDDEVIVPLDTSKVGTGKLTCYVVVTLTDDDYKGGVEPRPEALVFDFDEKIVKPSINI